MITRSEISRMAHRLLEEAEAQGKVLDLERGINAWIEVLESEPEVRSALANPGIPLERRARLLARLAAELQSQVGFDVTPSLKIMARLTRESEFGKLRRLGAALAVLVDRRHERVRIRIRSARPLSVEAQERIVEVVQKHMPDMPIKVETEVDPRLIGGMIVSVGDLSYDGSVRGHLERIRRQTELEASLRTDFEACVGIEQEV